MKEEWRDNIARLLALAVFCIGTVAAGGGIAFIQKPAGVLYLLLWLVWGGMTMLLAVRGSASSYNRNQFLAMKVLGAIAIPLLILGAPWEYANFAGPIPRNGILSYIGLAVLAIGVALQAASMLELRGAYTSKLGIQKGQHLVTTGPYRFVRNPGYLGFTLQILGSGLALSSIIGLLYVVPVVVFIIWRTGREESMLIAEFGKEYEAYMKETKRLIPFVY